LNYWGPSRLARVNHLDVRDFFIEMSRGDIIHRYLWALRCFFDFLRLSGLVDEVAPRLASTETRQAFDASFSIREKYSATDCGCPQSPRQGDYRTSLGNRLPD